MKAGLSTSLVLHAALIAFGLFTLKAPSAHDVGDVQAIPVDMVPIEELTQLQQGDKTAPKAEKPAPKKTERPHTVPDAKTIGENEVDLDDVPKPEASPRKIDTASAPKPAPKPEPKPEPKPVEAKPAPAPAPPPEKVAEAPKPEPAPTPDAVAETIASAEETPAMEFPDELPKPESRPEPPKREVAKAEEKKPQRPTEDKTASTDEDLESIIEKTKALVSKEKPAGGGAKRSDQTASLGNDRPSNAQKLSASEMDALRQQFIGCWSPPTGVENIEELRVSVSFEMDPSGRVKGAPTVKSSSGNIFFDESALRAIPICDRRGIRVPKDKYETWAEVVVNFDLSDMF